MSIKIASFKLALLSGLILTGLVLDPAHAAEAEAQPEEQMEDEFYSDDEGYPEEDNLESGFEDLIFVPEEEDEDGEPENIALMIETSDNAYTQVIYFSAGSTGLSTPAEMVISELASDLMTEENARITVVGTSAQLSNTDRARISSISRAFGAEGVPGNWVQVSQPVTLAAAY